MSSHVGTVRDRTQQFISYREKGKKFSSASVYNNGESTRLLSQHDDNSLEEGHPSKASGQDPLARLQVAVELATEQITSLFRSCEKALVACNSSSAAVSVGLSPVERTIQDNVQRTLALELQKLSLDFRKQQKSYLMRLRERDGRKSTAANALGALDDEGTLATDTFLSEMQSLQVDNSVALADERDREVVKIVGSIHDLGIVMKDLSALVIEQGTVLDRIDCQLQETSSVVEQGVSQLRRAEKAQRRGILASCVLILCAMIAFLFVILIIKSIL
jgi:syntaxin 16